jgi:ArsR family transcriptional regulator, cadmium/lead-responsive transcriptional repressor
VLETAGATSSSITIRGVDCAGEVEAIVPEDRRHRSVSGGRSASKSSDINAVVSSVLDASPFRLPSAPVPTDLVAKYFRGLGDPIRLRILELLRHDGELTVGELVHRLGLPQPKVSNHLACLRWCGFIEARREGRTVHNRIADSRVAEMLDLAESLLADNAEHVAACCAIEEPKR